jgi:hypothetical protein
VVVIIKCRYKYCKNNNEVDKDVAIKEGSAYYCQDCYKEKVLKQQIEEYYSVNLPATAIQLLRKVINQLLYTNNYEAGYVLFIVKKIHINKLKINNPFGLTSYCNEGRNIDEWKRLKTNEEYKNIKNEIVQYETEDKVNFTYNPNNKKWTDLI